MRYLRIRSRVECHWIGMKRGWSLLGYGAYGKVMAETKSLDGRRPEATTALLNFIGSIDSLYIEI